MEVPCPMYVKYKYNSKLILQMFIYNILPKNKRMCFGVDFMWFGQQFRWGSKYIHSWIIQKKIIVTIIYQVLEFL